MSEIKWIKITTTMFEDEKIRYLESLPDSDTLIVIWVKILTLTGKCNAGGFILLTENIPYTDEMLSNQFNRPLNTIRLAMQMFTKLGMIEQTEKGYYVTNWGKHQSSEELNKIRENAKLRKSQQREREKLFLMPPEITPKLQNVTSVTPNVTLKSSDKDSDISQDSHNTSQTVTETEVEVDKEEEVEIDNKTTTSSMQGLKTEKISFDEYRLYINSFYKDIDCENEFIKFKTWWGEGRKELKRPKTAWHNWLDKARKWKLEHPENNNGHKPQRIGEEDEQRAIAKHHWNAEENT